MPGAGFEVFIGGGGSEFTGTFSSWPDDSAAAAAWPAVSAGLLSGSAGAAAIADAGDASFVGGGTFSFTAFALVSAFKARFIPANVQHT